MGEDPDGTGYDPYPIKDVEDAGDPPVDVVHRSVERRFYHPNRIKNADKEIRHEQEAVDRTHKPTIGFLRIYAQQKGRTEADSYSKYELEECFY